MKQPSPTGWQTPPLPAAPRRDAVEAVLEEARDLVEWLREFDAPSAVVTGMKIHTKNLAASARSLDNAQRAQANRYLAQGEAPARAILRALVGW